MIDICLFLKVGVRDGKTIRFVTLLSQLDYPSTLKIDLWASSSCSINRPVQLLCELFPTILRLPHFLNINTLNASLLGWAVSLIGFRCAAHHLDAHLDRVVFLVGHRLH